MYKSFRTNAKYLTHYHAKSAMFWIGACCVGAALRTPTSLIFIPAILLLASTEIWVTALGAFVAMCAAMMINGLQLSDLALLAATPIWVAFVTSLLHNASHGNFKPRWLNRIIGEATGCIQLVGFPDWVILHVIHHANPDDPERDPHPPLNQKFIPFMLGMRQHILKVLLREYFAQHGQTPESIKQIKRLGLITRVEQLAKVTFWFLALGPTGFAWFFAPTVVMKMVHYAWFNYATHQTQENETTIVNRTRGFYKAVNAVSFGLYYHGNHHRNPKLFNPSRLPTAQFEIDRSHAA